MRLPKSRSRRERANSSSSFPPSPSGPRIPTSAKQAHALNSAAPLATILNDVLSFSVGGAFLKPHCLFAYNAAQETYQRASIVVQMTCPGGHSHRLIYHFSRPSDGEAPQRDKSRSGYFPFAFSAASRAS